jgi:hypothetical protein
MKKISDRFRKMLRTVFRGIGVSVISLIIQACYGVLPPDINTVAYGPPPPQNNRIRGTVKANETGKPINGIKVSAEEIDSYVLTDKDGYFYLTVPTQEEYILKIEDIDGPANDGTFKQQTITVYRDNINEYLLISMKEDTGTD